MGRQGIFAIGLSFSPIDSEVQMRHSATNSGPTDARVPRPERAGGIMITGRSVWREFYGHCLLAGCFAVVLIAGLLEKARRWFRPLLLTLAVGTLIFVVYRPMLPGAFLMDDHRVMADDNPLVDGEFTLANIWFQTDFILSNIVFWAEWLLWGNHPGGCHAVNMVLHALSALLLWRVLKRLPMPGAWAAALIYAVHPVAVTSVARIAELKNTLSLPFFLLSFWAWLRFETGNRIAAAGTPPVGDTVLPSDLPAPAWRCRAWYYLSLIAFVLALLAKTSTVMLPPVLLLFLWWRYGKVAWRQVCPLIPFFLLALAFGVASAWFQKYQALADHPLPPESFAERLALAGNFVWFYLGKVLLPFRLNAFYPLWKVDAGTVMAYFPGLLLVATFVLGWRFRQTWGRHLLFGLGGFVITLFPVLGFFDGQYRTWFQVSDHLQYLPMIAPLALAVAGVAAFLGANTFRLAAMLLVLGCVLLASQRARIFSNEERLMRDCLVKNPAAWGAQNTLGTILATRHDLAGAIDNFKTALVWQPEDPLVNLNLAHALALQGNFAEAEPHFLTALKNKPIDPEIHRQFASALEGQGRNREALIQWQIALGLKSNVPTRLSYAALLFKTGDLSRAAIQLRQVVADMPDLPEALNNLAWLLATCADDQVRNGADAVRYAEKACALTGRKQAGMVGTLAAAYAEAGRFPEAVKTCQQTIDLATSQGNPQFAAVNRQLLALYEVGKPYHAR